MHFRFDGHLIGFRGAKELLGAANFDEQAYTSMSHWSLPKGVLGFADRRHFGRVHPWESEEACPPLKKLGMDAFADDSCKELHARLARSKTSLEEFC